MSECYVCHSLRNRPKLSESPIEYRFGKPVLPAETYSQRECRDCGLLFADCDVTEEYIDSLYASESVEWQKEFTGASAEIGVSRVAEFRTLARRMFDIKPWTSEQPAKILDFGCQTGEFNEVAKSIASVDPYGVELSQDYAEHAAKRWGNDHVHVGHLETAPFTPGMFDYISAQEVLEHLCDPLAVARKLRELIKPDGLLLVSVPSADYFVLKKRLYDAAGRRGQALVHTHIFNFTPASMRKMLASAGFEVTHSFGIGWHGRARTIGNLGSDVLATLTLGKRVFSPSLVCFARPI